MRYSTDRRTLWHFFSRDIAALCGLSLLGDISKTLIFFLHSFQLQILSLKLNNVWRPKKKFSFYYLICILWLSEEFVRGVGDDDIVYCTHILLLSSKIFCAGFFLFLRFKLTTIEALPLCLNYNFMFEIFLQGLSSRLSCHSLNLNCIGNSLE